MNHVSYDPLGRKEDPSAHGSILRLQYTEFFLPLFLSFNPLLLQNTGMECESPLNTFPLLSTFRPRSERVDVVSRGRTDVTRGTDFGSRQTQTFRPSP